MSGWTINVEAPANGSMRRATIEALFDGKVKDIDKGNLDDAKERRRVAKKMAAQMGLTVEELENLLMNEWAEALDRRRREQAQRQTVAPGSPGSPGSGAPYILEGNRISRRGYTRGGEEFAEPLCNFVARIVREEIIDDGSGED